MLSELELVVYVKSHDDPGRTAERIFGALASPFEEESSNELGGQYHRAAGLGFEAVLFSNRDTDENEMFDPEFEEYQYGLAITSRYWCIDFDTDSMEAALSEYYARLLAFELDLQTSCEILTDRTEESEIYDIRSYRRNPSFRLDQSPTTPKVFVAESRLVEDSFDDVDFEDGTDTEGDDSDR
jgi:hypothetical protein